MLGTLLRRWRNESRVSAVAPTQVAVGPQTEEPVSPWRTVRRRPLIDPSGAIRGWDLELNPLQSERAARTAAPLALQAVHDVAMTQAARLIAQSQRDVLIALSPAALSNPELLAALPARTIVRAAAPGLSSDLVERSLRAPERRHVRLAARNVRGAIALLDASDYPDRRALDAALRVNAPSLQAAAIAINLRTIDEMSAAMKAGYAWCCGAHTDAGRGPRKRELSAPAASTANILTATMTGRSQRAIAAMLRADVTLSYRLMRLVNSAAFGLTRPADSIEVAIALLGTRELCRWLAALLLASDASSPVAPAVQETALARAKLCELLALEHDQAAAEGLFMVGAFSLLGVLLDVPLEVPLCVTRLPDAAIDALISASGPWWPYLDAALAAEAGDVNRIEMAAQRVHVQPDRIVSLADDARIWAQMASCAVAGTPTQAK